MPALHQKCSKFRMEAAVAVSAPAAGGGSPGVAVTTRREGRLQETEFDAAVLALDRMRAARMTRVAPAPAGTSPPTASRTDEGMRLSIRGSVGRMDSATSPFAGHAPASPTHVTDALRDATHPSPPSTSRLARTGRTGRTKRPDRRDRSGIRAAYAPLTLEDTSDADCSSSSDEHIHTPAAPVTPTKDGVDLPESTPRLRPPFLNLKSPSKFQQLPTVDWLRDTHRNKRERRTSHDRAEEVRCARSSV